MSAWRRRRGQATTELALGVLVLLTTVLLGLYLTETSFLSMKVQEAATSAIWDATLRPIDDFSDLDGSNTRRNTDRVPDRVAQDLTRRYLDFDGLNDNPEGRELVVTRGEGLEVRCQPTAGGGDQRIDFDLPATSTYNDNTAAVPGRVNNQLRQWFQPRPAMACTAAARSAAFRLPETYADRARGGLFSDFREQGGIQLCAFGRPVANSCRAGLAVLLGDWGLDGAPGTLVVRDSVLPESPNVAPGTGNEPYRAMVRTLFEVSGARYGANEDTGGAATRFARKMAGQRPEPNQNERRFYMSYAGSEHDYVDMLEPDDIIPRESCKNCHFNTSGTHPAVGNPRPAFRDDWRFLRAPCFLGLKGCSVSR